MATFDFIDTIQKHAIQKERTCSSIDSFNKISCNKNDIIMHINVRSMNANFDKVKLLIHSLDTKPAIVICTETFQLPNYKIYELKGSGYEFKCYYNYSSINKNDGVMVFVNINLQQNTEVFETGRIQIINTSIKLNNQCNLEVTAVYRSHGIPKSEFITEINKFLIENKSVKNHLVIGDFNIDLLEHDNLSQEFLCNFLEKGYVPGIVGITRPPIGQAKGSCIDNIFIKTNNLTTITYKIKLSITDHYPIFIAINKTPKIIKQPETCINYKKLTNIASKKNWNEVLSMEDPNLATDKLLSEIRNCIEMATTKQRKNKQIGRKS